MLLRVSALSFVAAVSLSARAPAALYVTASNPIFDTLVGSIGCARYVETFGSTPNGFLASGYSSSTGPANWSATAPGGLFVDGGFFSTNAPGQMLTFNFSAPGLDIQAIGGNFFATDNSFTPMPAVVVVALDDGTSYVNLTTIEQSFVGFVSTTASISSISLSLPVNADLFPTVDRMIFGVVPAPGALVLFGLAGLAGLGGRRRSR